MFSVAIAWNQVHLRASQILKGTFLGHPVDDVMKFCMTLCDVMLCSARSAWKKKIMSCDVIWCRMMWCHGMFCDAAPLRMNRLLICGKPSHQMEEWRGPGLNRKNIYFIFILHISYFLNKDICTQVGIDCEYYLWHKLQLETHLPMTKTYANLYVT